MSFSLLQENSETAIYEVLTADHSIVDKLTTELTPHILRGPITCFTHAGNKDHVCRVAVSLSGNYATLKLLTQLGLKPMYSGEMAGKKFVEYVQRHPLMINLQLLVGGDTKTFNIKTTATLLSFGPQSGTYVEVRGIDLPKETLPHPIDNVGIRLESGGDIIGVPFNSQDLDASKKRVCGGSGLVTEKFSMTLTFFGKLGETAWIVIDRKKWILLDIEIRILLTNMTK